MTAAPAHILFIPSWYPDKENPVHGIFNRRIAECIALNHRVTVLFIRGCDRGSNTYQLEKSFSGNLHEFKVCYRKPAIMKRLRSFRRLMRACDIAYAELQKQADTPG